MDKKYCKPNIDTHKFDQEYLKNTPSIFPKRLNIVITKDSYEVCIKGIHSYDSVVIHIPYRIVGSMVYAYRWLGHRDPSVLDSCFNSFSFVPELYNSSIYQSHQEVF